MAETARENQVSSAAVKYETVADMGSGLVIAKVKLTDFREQDINARIMKTEMQKQLTDNIKKRGQLESLPFCALIDGKIEIISGHHRIRSAKDSGVLTELFVILDTTGLRRSQVAAKQLAHNAISGFDDQSTLKEIAKMIDDVDDMLESYIGKDIIGEPMAELEKLLSPKVEFDWKNVTFTFLPHQLRDLDQLVKVLGSLSPDMLGVADIDQHEEFIETITKYAVSGGIGGTVYAGTKEDLSASDDSVIAAYFKAHTDVAVKKGDVFVVTTTVGNSTYEKSAYFYDGKAWVAMTGNVDADKVILRDNITLAGGYTQVGNLTKSQNGTSIFSTKGKSVMDALTEIFSKRLQPSITAQPSIGTFTLTGAGAVEAGTKVAAAAYSGATLNAGSYQYGPATGVVATNFKVERITNAATTQVVSVAAASLTAGSDNNGGAGFIIGDAGGDNAVSSLKYRVTATHGAGVTAKDNLGAASSPAVAIAAGTKTKDTGAYTPFRNTFYGTSTGKPALDSAAIRALGKTGKAYAAGTLTLNVPAGTQRVAIACIATAKGVTKVINETAMNADVTSTFVKSTVPVEGANGYAAKDYNVWVFEPAVAYGNAAVLKVTLG